METDLLPVNSDLIDLIEPPLLETVSNVNDDKDVVIADDLLDLELDAMILSQSTRSHVVSRVPYKKICDSQTGYSRLLPELCCKGQLRSNNDSTLLTGTRSPSSTGMPSLEMAWDPEPTLPTQTSRTLPPALESKTCWATTATEKEILHHRGDENNTPCRLCQQHFTTPAGCGYIYRSTSSPPSALVGSTAIIETTYSAINAQ